MSPNEKSVKRVISGPSKIDGGVCRMVELSDGSGRCQSWIKGSGWDEGGCFPSEFMFAPPASSELASGSKPDEAP
jgi:hypothetical protein